MRRIKQTIPFIILFLLFSLLGHELYSATPSNNSLTGESLPSFKLTNLLSPNQPLISENLHGKVMLLNVFATWCGACNAEHEMLLRIKNEYHVPIYGVLYRDQAPVAMQWLKKKGNPYVAIGDDARGSVAIDLGIYGTPETYVINPQGRIVYRHVGVINQSVWDNEMYPLIKQYES